MPKPWFMTTSLTTFEIISVSLCDFNDCGQVWWMITNMIGHMTIDMTHDFYSN
jgi:hypothetical protein